LLALSLWPFSKAGPAGSDEMLPAAVENDAGAAKIVATQAPPLLLNKII